MNRHRTRAREDDLRELRQAVHDFATSARDLDRVLDLASTRDCVHDRALDHATDLAHAYARGLARALARDLDRATDLARALDLALALDLDRARDLARALARDLARDLARALAALLERVEQEVEVQGLSGAAAQEDAPIPPGARPRKAAVWLSRCAGRLLPTPARARYAEELLDEVYAEAASGAGRWGQITCALRQVVPGVWQMRAALRERRRASRVSGKGA